MNNQLLSVLIKVARDCETKYRLHDEHFRFNISPTSPMINTKNIHHQIAVELLNHSNITWAHVISFISFSAILAEDIVQHQPHNEDSIIELFIDQTVNLIDGNLDSWLEQHHHWVKHF